MILKKLRGSMMNKINEINNKKIIVIGFDNTIVDNI